MSNQPTQATILLFSRGPDDESAKSRLRKTLPSSVVSLLHRAFVLDTLTLLEQFVTRVDLSCYWDVESENELSSLRHLIPASHEIQQGVSFAEKLTNSLLHQRCKTSAPIVLIGSDCPLLSPEILLQAIEATESGNLVIGPAPQGGFYLVGLPETADVNDFGEVFQDALEVCALRDKYSVFPLHLLPFLYDIDLEDDLISLLGELRLIHKLNANSEPPHSQAWLPEKTYQALEGMCVIRNESSRDKKIASR